MSSLAILSAQIQRTRIVYIVSTPIFPWYTIVTELGKKWPHRQLSSFHPGLKLNVTDLQ